MLTTTEIPVYIIEIHYEKKDIEIALLLKGGLENKGNRCILNEIIKDEATISKGCDFVIIIGSDKATTPIINSGIYKSLFEAYGCMIAASMDMKTFILNYNSKIPDSDYYEFIEYYKNTCFADIQDSEAKTLYELNENKVTKESSLALSIAELPQTIMDKFDIKASDKVSTAVLKGVGTLATIPFGLASLAIAAAISAPEMFIKTRINKVKETKFDKKFIPYAQKDILAVRMTEIIRNTQTGA